MPTSEHRLVSETALGTLPQIVPAPSGPLGNRWVFLGDSITSGGTNNAGNSQTNSYPLWVQLLSRGSVYMRNAGEGGQRTDEMLARFDTDVTAHNPNVVVFMGGTNNIGQGYTFDTYKADIEEVLSRTRDIGASLVLCTMIPRNDDILGATTVEWNQWLKWFAMRNGIHLVDMYRAVLDSATGNIKAEFDSDGVHPNNRGRYEMGAFMWNRLAPHVREWTPPLVQSVTDQAATISAASNPLLLTEHATIVGAPDKWSGWGTGTRTYSLGTHPDVIGNVAWVTVEALNQHAFRGDVDLTRFSPGERVWIGGKLFTDGIQILGSIVFRDAAGARYTVTPALINDVAVDAATFGMEFIVPSTHTASAQFEVTIGTPDGPAGTGGFAQPTMVNLTRLGL